MIIQNWYCNAPSGIYHNYNIRPNPKVLVRLSTGLITPGIWVMIISPDSLHPWISNNRTSVWWVLSMVILKFTNINSKIISFIDCSMRILGKPKFPKHIPQEPRIIVISYSINKFWFHGNQCIDILIFRPVQNCTPVKYKIKSSSGSPLGRLVYIFSVHKIHHLSLINILLGFGDIFIQ